MTGRSRPPTDDEQTAIHDREPGAGGRSPGQGAGAVLVTPTELGPPPQHQPPIADRSQPIRVISLKAPGDGPEERLPVKQHQARLRRLSEVRSPRQRVATPPGGLGYLAPPRDPREARTRRWREYLMWGAAVVIVAGAVMLGVWFLAGE